MKTLVVYFSRTGHTEQLASEIATREQAELEAIKEPDQRLGIGGYLRSAWQALVEACPPILPAQKDPSTYDLVAIGTPVWASRPAAPVRSYLMRHGARIPRVAFFCTEGGSGHQRVFDEMARLCGKPPVATLVVKERAMSPGSAHADQLGQFITALPGA